ncbi:hypothetical protein L6452_19275 [Arctium lappa]|uniref:Uncharacterized protein n=1 Tax=Arctium lappa TaxID=4217 RepID=A0ACB9B9H7_ARCLA|nr:hypothetical protein L6452_19275 [Arctium lappa]
MSRPSFIKSHLHRSLDNNNNDEILLALLGGNSYFPFDVSAHLSRSPNLDFPNLIKFPDNPPLYADTLTFFGPVNGLISFCFRTSVDFVIQIWNPSLSPVLTLPPFNGLDWFLFDDSTHELHFRFRTSSQSLRRTRNDFSGFQFFNSILGMFHVMFLFCFFWLSVLDMISLIVFVTFFMPTKCSTKFSNKARVIHGI